MKDKTKAVQGNVRAVIPAKPSVRLRTMLGTSAAKRILAALLCFAVSFFIAGAEAFPGTYPFGIAAVSAVVPPVVPAADAALAAVRAAASAGALPAAAAADAAFK